MYPLPPASSEFGLLRFVRIFDSYDYARIFACVDETGRIFVAFQVEEPPELDTWLLVRVSAGRFAELEAKRLDLREMISRAEDGSVLRVIQDRERQTAQVVRLSRDVVPEDWLPPR